MRYKSIITITGLFITFVLFITACTQELDRSSALKLEPTTANQYSYPSPSITAKFVPTTIQTPTSSQVSIDEQMQQAIETAQTRLQQSLQGTTLQQAEQNLQNWAKMNRDQVDYEKNNGTVTKNQAGSFIFTGQSAIWFSNLLTELKLPNRR